MAAFHSFRLRVHATSSSSPSKCDLCAMPTQCCESNAIKCDRLSFRLRFRYAGVFLAAKKVKFFILIDKLCAWCVWDLKRSNNDPSDSHWTQFFLAQCQSIYVKRLIGHNLLAPTQSTLLPYRSEVGRSINEIRQSTWASQQQQKKMKEKAVVEQKLKSLN